MNSKPTRFFQRSNASPQRPLPALSAVAGLVAALLVGCGAPPTSDQGDSGVTSADAGGASAQLVLDKYITVPLETEIELSDNQKQVISLLIEAADIIDGLYWRQAYGDPTTLLDGLDDTQRRAAVANFGPWDRLGGNASFLEGVGPKPPGARFYPDDVTQAEVENAIAEAEAAGDAERVDALKGPLHLHRAQF